ncbi:hypothetical protein JYB62_05000 [Algoriphagus lutimaris]|uniref:hypothetical protein n=1 Tax=Algoriphagus lutimaris TaxID=613197 RepID=UPI00196B452E|nr:hypothetical protein [Algoriphagus lutimaris]MBN3519352.1 hypothetical protein [Algoriphagus lutimaris]
MKNIIQIITSLVLLTVLSINVYGQDEGEESMEEVAKKLANPNASIGLLGLPIDFINYGGDLNGANSQNAFKVSFQPSLPYVVKPGQNIFFRPLIPIIISQPTINESGEFEKQGVDLGDIGFDLAYGITWESKWITLLGIVGSAPTATNKQLGTGRWMLGPEMFLGKNTSWGMFGVLLTQSWSLNKNSAADHDGIQTPEDFMFLNDIYYPDNETGQDYRLNITSGQYFYTINLKKAWQIQAQPTFTINHKASKGNKISVPIGTGLSKTIKAGKNPLKFSIQYWYYAVSPENFGPQHQIRFQIGRIVPLPW